VVGGVWWFNFFFGCGAGFGVWAAGRAAPVDIS